MSKVGVEETAVLNMRIPVSLKADAQELAAMKGVSLSDVVRLALGKYIVDQRADDAMVREKMKGDRR